LEQLVNASDGVDYSAGTMVWTLFDYYGKYHQSSSAFIVLVDQL
jgi:hypothetical protein